MKKIYTILAGCFMGMLPLSAQMQLSLEECQKMALQHNKELAATARQTRAADYLWRSMKANYFPDFSLSGMAAYSTTNGTLTIPGGKLPVFQIGPTGVPMPVPGFAYFPDVHLDYKANMIYMGGIRLKQPIYMGGKIRAAHKMAGIGKDIALLNERKTAAEIIYETDQAYILAVKAKEMLKVAEKYEALLNELLKNVESAHRIGLKPQNDVLKVKVRHNDCLLSKKKAENALRLATMNLCHYIGKPLSEKIEVTATFPEWQETPAAGTDIIMRPEYEMLEKQVAAARQQIKIDRSSMLPQIGLVGDYSYSHGFDLNDQPLLDGGAFSALLNVSIPLFHFGERKNKVRASKEKLEQLILEKESLNEKMQLELTQALNNLNEMALECQLSAESLKQAEENMQVSWKQYQTGLEPLSDYLEAQLLWQQAYEKTIESKTQHFLSLIAFKKASGTLVGKVAGK